MESPQASTLHTQLRLQHHSRIQDPYRRAADKQMQEGYLWSSKGHERGWRCVTHTAWTEDPEFRLWEGIHPPIYQPN